MKIVLDLTSLNDNLSGIERFALNIARYLIINDQNNEYTIIFKNKISEEFSPFINEKRIKAKIIKGKSKFITGQIILPIELYKIKADKYIFLAFPSPILFYKNGIFNTIHDLTCWDFPQTMKFLSRWYFKLSILNAIKISERIITVSEFSKDRIRNKFNFNNKIDTIYNGVSDIFEKFINDFEINKEVQNKFNLPENYIMSLGTLEPRKNLKLLIDAYVELKREKKIKEKLVLVGRKGWKFDSVIESIDEEIKKEIIFTGFVEDKYLPYIYFNTNLFIMPSMYEGFGIPVIEAISINAPVLLSNIPPFIEITKNNAEYFESNNLIDLKSKIQNVLNDKIYKEKTLLDDISEYKWNIQSKKLLKIIDGKN